jgi:hypothetical protein
MFVREPEGEIPLARPRYEWEDFIKVDFNNIW